MKFLFLVGLLGTATSLPIPLEQFGGSSSEQRFNFFPPPILPFLPQFPFPPAPQPPLIPFPFPFPNNPNQVILTLNDLIVLITAILNQLGGFFGVRFYDCIDNVSDIHCQERNNSHFYTRSYIRYHQINCPGVKTM